ncbi:hypothetical protein [uncultured Microbacterium sp.]|uniref:hypothetical protein n=1 Tax=uncultured Microbacterium sp. TaxID=191216 RepID=UPI0025E62550|nr:hypothetical protein [uncultured Microbacterium sp.]
MHMSVELVGAVVSALAVVVTLGLGMFGGFAWVVRRIDRVDDALSTRIDQVEDSLSARIERVERNLSEARAELNAEITEVKISVARLEGPRPPLLISR